MGVRIMVVTTTEFKTNRGKYLSLVTEQDIYITKNGNRIAKLTNPAVDKVAVLDSLVGFIPPDASDFREERLARQ